MDISRQYIFHNCRICTRHTIFVKTPQGPQHGQNTIMKNIPSNNSGKTKLFSTEQYNGCKNTSWLTSVNPRQSSMTQIPGEARPWLIGREILKKTNRVPLISTWFIEKLMFSCHFGYNIKFYSYYCYSIVICISILIVIVYCQQH